MASRKEHFRKTSLFIVKVLEDTTEMLLCFVSLTNVTLVAEGSVDMRDYTRACVTGHLQSNS